ncbi:MAG: phosphoenolpyruvate--protein phosphotransferase [Candidatus Omnitrophica bacterium CG11_big_fil_rev_8_21_14_0_20_45_26]|uniref:Phosphoenolpyruvate-protein phosphotransferase n=1 Tax=Candidatus Abzuiibacterium crystallinum TaxID=1974748 RepID=A0A2H0LMV4_9BACT|nr:MAG: phosphoenolpyruvate--protein phosphotransferase [Candidatus Omnitrophica bacterium CG11_big_fil_rev_8_21_14_0_20_45_26]PIW65214.1 MAG: phosphoenolpyruvate--protein phosphotransferase [Candidatus Omnitrophica bacterium CG12_big_fil_rev_8_21_14_0_65_45_16]
MLVLHGIPVSPGFAIGQVRVFHSEDFFSIPAIHIHEDEVPREIARFEEALTKTRAELLGIRRKISNEIGHEHSDIFNAHLLILEDRTLIEDVIQKVREEKVMVERAFSIVVQRYFHAFSQIDDEYLRERVSDIKDIGRRIMRNLMGHEKESLSDLKEPIIIIAHDLSPSETASMDKKNVIAFATDIGGPTSHTAIMARSLEIPAVVGLDRISKEVVNGDTVIVDGTRGDVILDPDTETLDRYNREEKRFIELISELDKLQKLPAKTLDGHQITLSANIEFPDEIPSVLAHGADSIGLYRTEYFYLNRPDLPTEEEQFEAYKTVAEKMAPKEVVVRTLDLGGDKFLSSMELPHEMNPFLGWRAIRFCLTRVDIFKVQLRAVLRASAFGHFKIMFPMISTISEFQKAREILNDAKEELKREGVKIDDQIQVGAMIEIPSAAVISDILAKSCDFFSIGSNDLIQYALAVDRGNEKIAYLYQPTHPAILKLVSQIITNGKKEKKWVGICGEMGGDPIAALLLVGLGIDEISTSAFVLPKVKKAVRSVRFDQLTKMTRKAMRFSTAEEIRDFAEQEIKKMAPDLFAE